MLRPYDSAPAPPRAGVMPVWVPEGPFSVPYLPAAVPLPEDQGTALAGPLVPVNSFAHVFRPGAKPRSPEALAAAVQRIERGAPPLLLTDVPLLARHRTAGERFYWAFVRDPYETSNCELGRMVAAQMPAVLATLEARLAQQLGTHTPEEIKLDGTWVERLRQFIEQQADGRPMPPPTPHNARTLAQRFIEEQWHEVILTDLHSRQRFQTFVIESDQRRRYADRPVDDRDGKPDETAVAKRLFQQLGPARENRDEWLRHIGVIGRRYPSVASTIGLG